MNVGDLSIFTRIEGYDEALSLSEFSEYLNVEWWSSKEFQYGWAFWMPPERYREQLQKELTVPISSRFPVREIKDKIIFLMGEIASITWRGPHLVQFWAPEVVDQRIFLTTAHQPFAVGSLCKGLSWYRQRCMGHRYHVDEAADEEEFGAVGRVYRNKQPESTPDLRLYSTSEFPLRDDAARNGFIYNLAMPVFDLAKEKCYGVIEVSCFHVLASTGLHLKQALKAMELRTTHLNFNSKDFVELRSARSEITRMLELAIRVMPQVRMAQVWVPCRECSSTSNNLSCMERETFIDAGSKRANSSSPLTDDYDIIIYHLACQLHTQQTENYTNMIAAVMSSNNKSCICRDICDFSITENPLAHYALKARLSFCFAICLQSVHNDKDTYVVEFFLKFNSREDAFAGSSLSLLLMIMEMELKSFEFAYKGQHGEELVVEVLKKKKLTSAESSQSNALGYESIKYKQQSSEELSMLMVMEECKQRYALSDFTKYLQNVDLHCLQPSKGRVFGWTFWSQEGLSENEVQSNSLLPPDPIQEKIKCLMSEIASKWDWHSYALAQFWVPKMHMDRCYLETSGQPFALGCLHKGLAFFRKQCMEHRYFVDKGAKENELGPPGRVILKGHPEITPDLRLYSATEFPLRNRAANCGLRKYFVVPVFDLNKHKCVGALELVDFNEYTLDVVENALKAANLSSNHFNIKPSFPRMHLTVNNDERRQLAFTEIHDACQLFAGIPQLSLVEVWVPCRKCFSNNNNLLCMERVWAMERELDRSMCLIQHVETGKGIAGMALASENKSCFCRNLCEFSIVEQPLAHFEQRTGLDVCFAICLQSCHTGALVYVLEFYLNQVPRKYEHLKSFLSLLLPIMKHKLNSFKIASGQQLGENLVVEVIEFSEVDELAFSELDQMDVFPITFKFVKYGGQKHSRDKQVQFAPDSVESVTSVTQAKDCSTSSANLKRKKATEKTEDGKPKTHLRTELEDLAHLGQKLNDVAEALGVSTSTIMRILRNDGFALWTWNKKHKNDLSPFIGQSANVSAHNSQQNLYLSSCRNLSPSYMPLHQNVPHTNPKSSRRLIVQPKADTAVIKAKYEDDTIRFELCGSAGHEKLLNEVGRRLNLTVGSFKLTYLDEVDDQILLVDDEDLQRCLKDLAATGKPYLELLVQSQ